MFRVRNKNTGLHLLLLFIFCSHRVFSQPFELVNPEKNLAHFSEGNYRAWVGVGNKQYLVDRTGKIFIESDWSGVDFFIGIEEIVTVVKDGVSCAFDIWGQPAFCAPPNADMSVIYDPDHLIPYSIYDTITHTRYEGWLNHDGSVAIPAIYKSADYTTWDPWSAVMADSLWGYINKKGETVIPFRFEDANLFYNDYATVKLNGKWGIIDTKGVLVVPCRFDWIESISTDNFYFRIDGKFGRVSTEGQIVLGAKYDYITGAAPFELLVNIGGTPDPESQLDMPHVKGGKWYVIKENGEVLLKLKCDYVEYWGSEENEAKKNGKWGTMDKNGKWIIKPRFEDLWLFDFSNSKTAKLNGKWGVIDPTGKWLLQPDYDAIGLMRHGLVPIKQDGKWGYMNEQFEWVLPPQFDNASEFTFPGEHSGSWDE